MDRLKQNLKYNQIYKNHFAILLFLASAFLFKADITSAQDGNIELECAEIIEQSPDCLLTIMEQLKEPEGAEVPSFLIENIHRDERVLHHTLMLISSALQDQPDKKHRASEPEKRLYKNIAQTCNLETYKVLAGHIRKLGRDESKFAVIYIANLPHCESLTVDDLEELRTLLESIGSEADGLFFLVRNYVAMGELDHAIELANRIFDLYGDSFDMRGPRFGPTPGDAIVTVVGALLSNQRVDDALTLTRLHLEKDWAEHFFQRLVDVRVNPKDAESFLEFADRLNVPEISNLARGAAVVAHMKLGKLDKALDVLEELEEAPVAEMRIRGAYRQEGVDTATYDRAVAMGLITKETPKKISGKSRKALIDLASAHNWLELESLIESQPSEELKLQAKRIAGEWTLRNRELGGADIQLAERAFKYLRESYSLVAEKSGHKVSFLVDSKWASSPQATQILEMAEQSGLFEPIALRSNFVWVQLFRHYALNELTSFETLIDELKTMEEGLTYAPSRFCLDIGSGPQAQMCIHALKENWRLGKDGQRSCQYLTEYLEFGSLENAVLSLNDIKDDTTKANCALHLWIEQS